MSICDDYVSAMFDSCADSADNKHLITLAASYVVWYQLLEVLVNV